MVLIWLRSGHKKAHRAVARLSGIVTTVRAQTFAAQLFVVKQDKDKALLNRTKPQGGL
jgi:hypothetical protein